MHHPHRFKSFIVSKNCRCKFDNIRCGKSKTTDTVRFQSNTPCKDLCVSFQNEVHNCQRNDDKLGSTFPPCPSILDNEERNDRQNGQGKIPYYYKIHNDTKVPSSVDKVVDSKTIFALVPISQTFKVLNALHAKTNTLKFFKVTVAAF